MIGEKKYNYQKLSNSRNNATLDDYLTDDQKKKKANNTSNLLAAYTNPQQETATTLPYYQNENSSSASSSNTNNSNNITLKDYYGSAQSSLEQNRQKQLEEAYVNNQLINKYFPESMAKQGLANTGIAELYKQKANNDYRNERANINSNYENNQLNLLENYYAKQKADEEEQKQKQEEEYNKFYERYGRDAYNDALDSNGKITQEKANELKEKYESMRDKLGDDWTDYILYDIDRNTYTDSDEDRILQNQENIQKAEKEKAEKEVLQEQKDLINVQNDKEYVEKTYKNYGIDTSNYVSVDTANEKSFGNYFNLDGKQDQFVRNVINEAKKAMKGEQSLIKNGDIINFNVGAGISTSTKPTYLYYNGIFYKVNVAASKANITDEGFWGDNSKIVRKK